MGDNIDHLLPQDDELVRRENIFLGLFDKFSIDEGDDAQLADLDKSDEMEETDENASGSSFSETSSVEGDEANGSCTAIDEITDKLEPVIQKRVNDWPEKGINLQLKRADPSLSVEEWLKANQESTTTTKKYKKTVVNEENKTTITTTKHTRTTTKRATFNSFHIPRMLALKEMHKHKQIVPAIEKGADVTAVTHAKASDKIDGSKPKDQQVIETVPVSIKLSKLSMDKPKLINAKQLVNKQLKKPIEPPIHPSVNDKSKQSTKRQHQSQPRKEVLKNIPPTSVLPPSVDENRRCLRSRFKPLCDEITVDKPQPEKQKKTNTKATTKKKSQSKEKKQESTPIDSEVPTMVPHEKKTESIHRSRSPLKDRQTNNRREPVTKPLQVRVKVTRLELPKGTTRQDSRMRNAVLEQTSTGGCGVTPTVSMRRGRSQKDKLLLPSPSVPAIENSDSIAQILTGSPPQRQRRQISMRNPPLQRPQIVIHSPSHEMLLGTKIDNTSMLVTENDYKKHINPKYVRKTNIFDRSVVPINRRIVYQPPIHDVTAGDTDNDSECEDVLLSSYWHTGRFEQIKVWGENLVA